MGRNVRRLGLTLVEIMVVVIIIALLAAIALPSLMRAKLSANDALAQNTLKGISASAESFSIANNNNYPSDETSLVGATPPYAGKTYCGQVVAGYSYTCTFNSATYKITAIPVTAGNSGSTTFTVMTGGMLIP